MYTLPIIEQVAVFEAAELSKLQDEISYEELIDKNFEIGENECYLNNAVFAYFNKGFYEVLKTKLLFQKSDKFYFKIKYIKMNNDE